MPRSHDIFGSGHAAEISRQNLSAEFKGLLEGAHAGLKPPTLQVAAPVMVQSWQPPGGIVIHVDRNRLLKADLGAVATYQRQHRHQRLSQRWWQHGGIAA
ncbi:MAG: hypothetical protein U0997_09575 [Sulfurimicrobium sp.]|nr:hypothetical protein [Sulfurimicrobium sp.]